MQQQRTCTIIVVSAVLLATTALFLTPYWSPGNGARLVPGGLRELQGRIAFVAPSGLIALNPDGTHQALIIDRGITPAWSSDNAQIAFWADGSIFVMEADGSHLRQLTVTDSSFLDGPYWSPRNTYLNFVTQNGLYALHIETKQVRRLGGDKKAPLRWAQSPDETHIALQYDSAIFVTTTDGSHWQHLADVQIDGTGLSWSPDSTQLAFASDGVLYVQALEPVWELHGFRQPSH